MNVPFLDLQSMNFASANAEASTASGASSDAGAQGNGFFSVFQANISSTQSADTEGVPVATALQALPLTQDQLDQVMTRLSELMEKIPDDRLSPEQKTWIQEFVSQHMMPQQSQQAATTESQSGKESPFDAIMQRLDRLETSLESMSDAPYQKLQQVVDQLMNIPASELDEDQIELAMDTLMASPLAPLIKEMLPSNGVVSDDTVLTSNGGKGADFGVKPSELLQLLQNRGGVIKETAQKVVQDQPLPIETKSSGQQLPLPDAIQTRPDDFSVIKEQVLKLASVPVLGGDQSADTDLSVDDFQLNQVAKNVFSNLGLNKPANTGFTSATQQWMSRVDTPVPNPRWGAQVAERVVWMAKNDTQGARLNLTPEHLGPMEIHLNITDDKATVNFHVTHATTKEALDAALPRLREMFAHQGMDLVEVNVSDRDARQQMAGSDQSGQDQGQQRRAEGKDGLIVDELSSESLDSKFATRGDRILDHYA